MAVRAEEEKRRKPTSGMMPTSMPSNPFPSSSSSSSFDTFNLPQLRFVRHFTFPLGT
jgi:hypothetical protein